MGQTTIRYKSRNMTPDEYAQTVVGEAIYEAYSRVSRGQRPELDNLHPDLVEQINLGITACIGNATKHNVARFTVRKHPTITDHTR